MLCELSFDPQDPLIAVEAIPGLRLGVQVFTTSNVYCLDAERLPTKLQRGDALHLAGLPTVLVGQQRRGPSGRVDLDVEPHGTGISIRARASHEETVKSIKLLLHGLPQNAPDGGWWHATAPADERVWPKPALPFQLTYPGPDWVTRWAAVTGGDTCVALSVRDDLVRPARLWVSTPPYLRGASVAEIVLEEDAARWTDVFESPEVLVHPYADVAGADSDFAEHLEAISRSFALPAFEHRSDVPAWFGDVRLVVNLHGEHWTGYIFNTYADMEDVLRAVTSRLPGQHVIAYLPGWEGRYYFAYPNYKPASELGGEEGFASLCNEARRLGVHLMPMFGANGVNAQVYPNWGQATFRSRTDRYARLFNAPDWDGDRSPEDDQVFCNPGEGVFRGVISKQILDLVARYPIDSVLLDTSGTYVNDPRYNLFGGLQALVQELHTKRPDLLVAGEGWWDALLGTFPVNQTWTGIRRQLHYPEILTRFGRVLGHLKSPAPGLGSTGVHERGFLPPEDGAFPMPGLPPIAAGHIPAVSVVKDTLREHGAQLLQLCDELKR